MKKGAIINTEVLRKEGPMEGQDPRDAVRKALKRACLSEHGLVKNTGIPYSTLRPILRHLIEVGLVEKDGHRFYLKEKPRAKPQP